MTMPEMHDRNEFPYVYLDSRFSPTFTGSDFRLFLSGMTRTRKLHVQIPGTFLRCISSITKGRFIKEFVQ